MKNFKELLYSLGSSPKLFSEEIGITVGSFRTMTAKGRMAARNPAWMKAFELGVQLANEKNDPMEQRLPLKPRKK